MEGAVALAWALFVLCMVTQAFGSIVVMDAWREVGITGTAFPLSFSSVKGMNGAGEFAGSVSEVADSSGVPWGRNRVAGSAVQNTVVDENGVRGSGSFRLDAVVPLAGPYNGSRGSAWNELSFTFLALEAQEFTLSLSSSLLQMTEVALPPVLDFSLVGLASGSLFTRQHSLDNFWSGVLLPDTYTFRLGTEVVVASDPLGDMAYWDYTVNLAVTNVPDTGSTMLLLGLGVAGLIVVKRRMAVA